MTLIEYLDYRTEVSNDAFQQEINTDENKDYRRGFRAGALFAYLDMKCNIRIMEDAATEQPTD
jgi:hypothetical protein